MKLDIGGGLSCPAGWTNLDPVHGVGEFKRYIQEGIPLPDNSVEEARCSHLMEHIPAGRERINAFNEVWRVLRPSGMFEVVVPLYSPDSYGWAADPTHVSIWVEQSFWYFTGRMSAAAVYGIRLWRERGWRTEKYDWGLEGHCTLQKP